MRNFGRPFIARLRFTINLIHRGIVLEMDNATGDGKRKQFSLLQCSPWKTLQGWLQEEPGTAHIPRPKPPLWCANTAGRFQIIRHYRVLYNRDASLELRCQKILYRAGKAFGLRQHYFNREREKERKKAKKERICVKKDTTKTDERDNPKIPTNRAGSPPPATHGEKLRRATIDAAAEEGQSPQTTAQGSSQGDRSQPRCFCHPRRCCWESG